MIPIPNLLESISTHCEHRPYAVLVGILLVTLVLGSGIPGITMETDQSAFLPGDKESIIATNLIFEEFGGQSLETVLVSGPVTSLDSLYALESLKKAILADPALEGFVISVSYYYDMYASAGLVPRQVGPQAQATLIQVLAADAASESPRVVGRAVTADGQYALMSVRVSSDLSEAEAVEPVRRLQELVNGLGADSSGLEAWVTGDYSMMLDNMETINKDNAILMPLAAIFIIAVLALIFRRITDVVFPFLTIAVALVWVLGIMGHVGIAFTAMLVALAPLLLGITIDYAIHIIFRYNEERAKGESVEVATRMCLRHTGTAVFLSAGTTVFGFLSFGISELPPMRDFGILAVIGIVASFILVVTLMPALTVLRDRRSTKVVAPQKTGKDASLVGKALARVVTVTLHHRRPVLGIVALISLCSLVALPQVETTINWEDMMPDNLPSLETAERIGEIFGTASGGGNLLISVEGDLFDPATIGKVLTLETELRAITGVNAEGTPLIASPYAVQSYADVLIQANNGNVPSSRLQIATLVEMLLGSPDSAQLLASTVVLDPSSAYYQTLGLISIQANALSEGDIDYIVTAVRDVVAGQEGSGIDYRVAGGFAIVSDIFGGLTSTQARTTVLALLLCFAVVALLQRSAFYGALALLPVALTILWEFLVLWALGWAFDLFTVMISALIVGIGIDFAVHIVHRFREEAERGVSTEEALTSVIMNVGKALLSTTVTTAGAFAIIGLSIMPMMARFGILTATTITFSFVIALFVLPPILAWSHERSAKA